jgi:predicted secreted protein
MRLRAILACLAMAIGSPAFAADAANFNAIGYSPDSRRFAFEQYGIQDGSGFPYWEIFVVDLKTNTWVKGAPVKALIEDETARLSSARAKAYASATPLLADAGIGEPASIIAAAPATEVAADRRRIVFDRWYRPMGATPQSEASADIRHEVSVDATKLPDPQGCPEADGPYFGFSLTLKDVKLGSAHAFYRDEAIPASRGCPIAYDIAAIVAPANLTDEDRMVAIVGVYARGFEGANQRFVAVPFVLSD